jgi:regulator of sigma E protease
MLNLVIAVLGISLVVVVHEAGHYFAARASGIRVTRFSLGFGPALLKFQPNGSPTVFQICAVPFLAYVTIAGMNPEEEVAAGDDGLYSKKSLPARTLTIFGGPLANYLFASIVVFGLALGGWREDAPSSPLVVANVERNSAASGAGLRVGDVVLEANGRRVADVSDLTAIIQSRALKPTTVLVERDGRPLPPLTLVPQSRDGRGVIGVWPKVATVYTPLSLRDAAELSVVVPYRLTIANLAGMLDLVSRGSTEGITGPVGMSKMVAAEAGAGVYAFVSALMYISVALGFFNLLPLPFLDGGRLMFLIYEAVTRRRPKERLEALVHAVGSLFLLALIALVTLRDVLG